MARTGSAVSPLLVDDDIAVQLQLCSESEILDGAVQTVEGGYRRLRIADGNDDMQPGWVPVAGRMDEIIRPGPIQQQDKARQRSGASEAKQRKGNVCCTGRDGTGRRERLRVRTTRHVAVAFLVTTLLPPACLPARPGPVRQSDRVQFPFQTSVLLVPLGVCRPRVADRPTDRSITQEG